MELENQISESWKKIQDNKSQVRQFKSRIADLKDEKEALDDLIDITEQSWDQWEALGRKLSEGVTVYAPSEGASKKRKRPTKRRGGRKNLRSSDSDEDSSDSDDSDFSNKENSQPQDEARQPLTEEEIDRKLATFKAEKKELRRNKKAIEESIADVRLQMKKVQSETDILLSEVKAICIKGRNEYSRKAIKHDFAMGIKE